MVDNDHQALTQDFVAIARIGKPVGLEGWCKLVPHGETLEKIAVPKTLWLGRTVPAEKCVMVGLKFEGNGIKGRFEGYLQREDVAALTNFDLFVPRDELPDKKPDEHYHFELDGMIIVGDASQKIIGTVIAIHNYPTIDALEIRKENGQTFILPMTRELIRKIDKITKRILVDDAAINELL